MNSVFTVDFALNEWIEDNDAFLSRKGAEFPRNSDQFIKQADPAKPWGSVSNPKYFDINLNPELTRDQI